MHYTYVEIRTRDVNLYRTMREWCEQQWGKPANCADDTWQSTETISLGYTVFYFDCERDATLFRLRWV